MVIMEWVVLFTEIGQCARSNAVGKGNSSRLNLIIIII